MIDTNGSVRRYGADVHRPAYRDFIVKLIIDVVRRYDVDGVHLDYIRTMGRCYCDKCKKEFKKQFGHPLTQATEEEWIKWQRQPVADIVRRVSEGVRPIRPHAIVSAAVFANMRAGAQDGQDPARWSREGWLDVVIPMDYQMQTLLLRSNERAFLDALDDDSKLVTGISLYERSGKEVFARPASLVEEQIGLVRQMGIHGYCLFVNDYLDDEILHLLKTKINRERAVPYFR